MIRSVTSFQTPCWLVARRCLVRGVCAALVVLLYALMLPSGALAQAQVVDPDGALEVRDGQITLAFDAPVDIRQVTVEVRDDAGTVIGRPPRLRDGDPQVVVADVQPDAHPASVRWQALSRDGHVTSGRIGTQADDAPARTVEHVITFIGRLLVIVAMAVVAGLVVLRWGVVGPSWRSGGLVPPGRHVDDEEFRARAFPILEWASNRWWDAIWIATVVWGVGIVATVMGTMIALRSTDLGGLLLHARLGQAALILVVLGVMTVVAGQIISRRDDGDDPLPPIWEAVALGVPAAMGLGVISWSSHAATGGDAAMNIALDGLHNVATALWIGGLVGLTTLLVPTGQRLEDDDRLRLVAASVVRFSALGLVAVALLVATGVYRAIAEVGSLGALVDSFYGNVLVAKIVVFALMCVVAGYNRLVIHPHLERAGLGLDPDDSGASQLLGRTVLIELGMAAVLLALVGVLIGSAPPG